MMLILESDKLIDTNYSFDNDDEEREPLDESHHSNEGMINPLIELDVNIIHSCQLYDSRSGMNSVSFSRLQSSILDDDYNLFSSRRRVVRFANPVVSETRERPCFLDENLFYSRKDYNNARENRKTMKNILETASIKISVSTSDASSNSSKSNNNNIPPYQNPYGCTHSLIETFFRNLINAVACSQPSPFGEDEYENNWSSSYVRP